MTSVRFIGDVHGKFRRYKRIIGGADFSIQVGDMGVGFRALRQGEVKEMSNPPFDAMSKGRHLFIRGNHDNPGVCRRHPFWIPDGQCVNGIFCLGGAASIDRAWRTPGLDWWEDEELAYAHLQGLIDVYRDIRPDFVCTHDCPQSLAAEITAVTKQHRIADGSRTRQALEIMLHHHQPRYWVFGHWHTSFRIERGRTLFQCLDELEHVDVDIGGPMRRSVPSG